tara:strand:+ start:1591 stop:2283 length:693 start_codon:yes stop_codon:yes gene_type:complete
MKGFYSKAEAARILGVSTRQVDNYIKARKLRRIKEAGKVWIPKQDVDLLYKNKSLTRVPTLQEISALELRMEKTEKQIKILQRGLGFGAGGAARGEAELRLLYQQVMDDLGEPGWQITRIMEFTEELSSFREEELESMLRLRGIHAMLPFFDLARRMISYVESHDQYPSVGTKAVRDRLIHARRVVLALVEITMKIETGPFTESAKELYRHLGEKPDFVSDHVGRYISSL